MRFFRRKDPDLEKDLETLEKQLWAKLQPVVPGAQFIVDLRNKLFTDGIQYLPSRQPLRISNAWLVVGGIVGSILMVIASIRGIISLINIVQNLNKSSQRQQTTPA
jgi:hypothetical protein